MPVTQVGVAPLGLGTLMLGAGCVILETACVGAAIGNALLKREGSRRWLAGISPDLGKAKGRPHRRLK